jgi:hypothetical protein
MSLPAQDQVCGTLLQKMTTRQRLSDEEKAHLAACEDCMRQVVHHLDRAATTGSLTNGTAEEASELNTARTRAEAIRALEQGRRVFQREFGISFPNE